MRKFWRWITSLGLTQKALFIFLPFIILPALGIGIAVYHQFTDIVKEQFIQSTLRNLDSIVSRLEEQTATVKDIADYLIIHPALNEFLSSEQELDYAYEQYLKQNVMNLLTFHQFTKKYIRSIHIHGYNGNFIEMGEPFYPNEDVWLDEAKRRRGGVVWTDSYSAISGWNREVHLISLVRILNSINDITHPQGELIIRLDGDYFLSQLEDALYKKSGFVYVVGPNGNSVLQSDPTLSLDLTELTRKIEQRPFGYANYEWEQTDYFVFYRSMEQTLWKIVIFIPEAIVNEETIGVERMGALIIGMMLLFCFAALLGLHSTIIRPVQRLKNETNRVKSGDFTAKVPIKRNDEITDLSRNFNEMVQTIRQLIEQRYTMALREKESELKQLQNQIDPHFLYNTLDMIRWTARLEKADKTSELIEVLSKFFRYGGSRSGGYVTTLSRELEFVQTYLYLQQKRLGNNLRYTLYTEAHIADAPILKMTIQPLVENFIKHGLKKKAAANRLSVRCYVSGAEIWIDVEDNGKGIPADELAALRSSIKNKVWQGESGALQNIHERLTIFSVIRMGWKSFRVHSKGPW